MKLGRIYFRLISGGEATKGLKKIKHAILLKIKN
jgi:hypothetical protein